MNDLKTMGKFAINSNLDCLQDIFELEEAFEGVIAGLMDSPEVDNEVWRSLLMARGYLDAIRTRITIAPMVYSGISPDSHKPEPVLQDNP